jgi:acyl-homoserine lactone acylase PvdQ
MPSRGGVAAVAVSALVGLVAAGTAGTAVPRDFAVQAWNVLPPGQAGGVSFTHNSSDQLALYDGLTALAGDVTARDITRQFKRATLGLGGEKAVRTELPRAGVTIQRDRWGVPHVVGRTREDVAFGAGWATAEDRQLIIELLRGPGRIAALDVPGVDPLALALSGQRFEPSAQTEAFLARQFALLERRGETGQQLARDIDSFVAGINAYYRSAELPIRPWERNDVVAVAGLMGAVFGAGGGDEVRRSQFLAALQRQLGGEGGRQVWEDLRQRDDPEAAVAVAGRFPYGSRPVNELGNIVVDAGSFEPLGSGATTTRLPMSNALLVAAARSATRKPLFVAGPQVGMYYPGILMELDLQGGGFEARGASFPGISFAILLGRGQDYVWSATSAGSDLIDQYVETLCEGSDEKYRFNGRCRSMTTFDAGVLEGAPGEADRPLTFRQTVHGPVVGYATVRGERVAVSVRRSTRGRELLSAQFFVDLSTSAVRSAEDFIDSAATMELTFNWLYADDRDIAQVTSGRVPLRPVNVDPGLPAKGTGEYEWRGFLPAAKHPHAINPRSGVILNWNNKPARAYAASDAEWTWGSVQRVDLLRVGIAARRVHTLASVVGVMNRAATQDLRVVRVWPVIREVLSHGSGSPRARVAAGLVDEWLVAGGSRLDRDLDGTIDAPGAAVLDMAWDGLADAVLSPVLGTLVDDLAELVPRDQPMNPSGSAYADGWWSYVDKDLRALLGKPVKGPYGTRFCGRGQLAVCASSLWAVLDLAAGRLEEARGADPAGWRADATAERIGFAPGILPQTMRGVNRPTFQQVFSFRSHRPR